jgi:hypothetical protein
MLPEERKLPFMTVDEMKSADRTPVRADYWKNPEFMKLKASWYGKLKEFGFVDIEVDYENEYIGASQEFNKNNKGERNGSGPEHHEYCHKILREFTFSKDIHRVIFELHADGRSHRDIEEWLTRSSYRVFDQKHISRIIARIKQDHSRG